MSMSSVVFTVGVSPPDAAGGSDTPTVKTTEDIDLEARQLNVREVREVAPTCTINP